MVTETVDPDTLRSIGLLDLIGPDKVVPIVTYLASRACESSHENYSARAGRYARVFVGLGDGWLPDTGAVATADDIVPPIEAYELWMRGRGLAVRTIGETMCTLRRVQRESGYPIEATPALALSRFLASEQLGARARYTYHGHLRGFYRWLADNSMGADAMATLPRPRMPRCTPRPITTAQLQTLLALPLRRRTRAMVLLASLAGLRAHEIAKVRGQDVDANNRTLYVIGKGGKRLRSPCTRSSLNSHARCRHAAGGSPPTRPAQVNTSPRATSSTPSATPASVPTSPAAPATVYAIGTEVISWRPELISAQPKHSCGTRTSPAQRFTPKSTTSGGSKRSTGSTRSDRRRERRR